MCLDPSLRFSSITFGSPPVLRWGLEEQNNLAAEGGLSLNIINEYDLVSRVDRSYVRTLVDLYRSIYDLPPIQGPDFQTTTDDLEKLASNYNRNNGTYWAIPKPVYRHIGKRVVLQFGISPTFDTSGVGQLALSALYVPGEQFAKLLFCRITVHSRLCYQERIEFITEGRFNGKYGWQSNGDIGGRDPWRLKN